MSNGRRAGRSKPTRSPAHGTPGDVWSDPEAQAWRRRANRELLPMIRSSAVSLTLWPSNGEPDAKLAVELGFTLLLGKPLVFLKPVGGTIPPNLERLADAILEYGPGDLQSPELGVEIAALVKRLAGDAD